MAPKGRRPSALELATDKWRASVAAGEQQAVDRLATIYGKAWDNAQDEVEQLARQIDAARAQGEPTSPSWYYRQRRARELQARLAAELARNVDNLSLAVQAAQSDMVQAARVNAAAQVRASLAGTPAATLVTDFDAPPVDVFSRLIGGTADGSPLRDVFAAFPAQLGQQVEASILAGLAGGKPTRAIFAGVHEQLGASLGHAMTVARTEVNRAYRETSRETYNQRPDVFAGWQWVCSRSARTCAMCWAMHGQQFPNDQPMGTHPNCACAMVPVTRSWSDLGFGDLEGLRPPMPGALTVPGVDEFAQLPDADRLRILGRSKYDAMESGEVKLSDLVGYRDHPGYGPTRTERSLLDIRQTRAGIRPAAIADDVRLGPGTLPGITTRARKAAEREVATAEDTVELVKLARRLDTDVATVRRARAELPELQRAIRAEADVVAGEANAYLYGEAGPLRVGGPNIGNGPPGGYLGQQPLTLPPPKVLDEVSTNGTRYYKRVQDGQDWDWADTWEGKQRARDNDVLVKRGRAKRWSPGDREATENWGHAYSYNGLDVPDALDMVNDYVGHADLADVSKLVAKGQTNPRTIVVSLDEVAPTLADEGYDIGTLLRAIKSDDYDALANIVETQAAALEREALQIAVDADRELFEVWSRNHPGADYHADLGPSPWDMDEWSYEGELLDIEAEWRTYTDVGMDPPEALRRRWDELVPMDDVDPYTGQPMSAGQLHEALTDLARRSGQLDRDAARRVASTERHGRERAVEVAQRQAAEQARDLARLEAERVAQLARAADDARAAADAVKATGRLTREQYDALLPDRAWSDEKRQRILEALRSDENGRILADTLDRFQDGGSIARLRTNIGKRLAGEQLDRTTLARVDSLLDALRHAPTGDAPDVLYRGMTVKGKLDNVLAKYVEGDELDLSLTSFTTDRKVATKFQGLTSGSGGGTRVMVELVGPDKRLLPIQNLARDRRLFAEKEWVGGGRYRIVSAKKSPSGGILLRIQQVGTL